MLYFDYISYILLPAMIFMARVADVTIATVKLMYVVNNARRLAAALGFVEALITIVALTRVMQDASNMSAYLMYAAGFATGTYVGMRIEEKIAHGSMMVRITCKDIPYELIAYLVENRYHYSMIEASDQSGDTQVLYTVCKRSRLSGFLSMVEQTVPLAEYTIESIRQVSRKPVSDKYKTIRPGLAHALGSH